MRDTVIIIGSGLMGSGIAACSALAGNKTVLVDINPDQLDRGLAAAKANIGELLANGLADEAGAMKARELISVSSGYEAYSRSASMVIEAVVENLEVKQKLFARLDQVFPPEVPLLSNTSGLRITDIALLTEHPERTVTTHFWFPGHLVPLVEVVVGDRTDIEIASAVRDTLKSWGKAAVLVKRDLPGQLANRILQAVIREAMNIVEIGLADPEDIDTAVKMGMGIRMPVWGPLEHIEAAGLDLCLNVQRTVLPEISSRTTPSPVMETLVEEGNLGYKTGSGFYDWSVKDMDELAKRRNDFIIIARKFMQERGD
ncbi:3-hydroxyacyl-CoA dehydrogenase family protein [Enterocloster lavalensis]|uniref:3-hydroxyacyl-CoA dehydrogenase family protein n=1 Tax=Enterocloster lavalensis TaxID=460384 RepID=UPI002FD960A0